MLSQYSWGDFALFVLVLVIIYYAVVGLLYYRQELSAFITRKGRGGAQLAGAGTRPGATAAAPPPSLVRTTSAFAPVTPTATAEATPPTAAGAAQSLPEGPPVAEVSGELPESTAAATGFDEGQDAAAPMDGAGEAAYEAEIAAELDEQRTEELDEVDTDLAERARQLAGEMPTEENGLYDEVLIENNNNVPTPIETISRFIHVEAAVAYEPHPASEDVLYSFEAPIASPTDVVPVPMEQLFTATSVVEFIAQAQAGNRPPVPAAIRETSLASLVADRVAANNEELNSLFGAESA
ncbi:hypothetical protein [Hymenobacter sp. B81]|uniref:hypothetical protein n=1 Tax=Hymenobacter sp. B81 TaxID=3344878 RepID=UPI0037DC053E